ncbi:MAG: DUF6754 domain-containing protein [Aggregatilineales bacterium]
MDSTIQIITTVIIVLAFAITAIATQTARRRRGAIPLRVIRAYEALPGIAGAAIEADRPLLAGFGSSGIGGPNTLLALASTELYYQTARRAAIGAQTPIAAVSEASALPLAYGALRRAYAERGRFDRVKIDAARWYPAGPRSLAYAAALTAALGIDRAAGGTFVGSFGPELALILDAAARRRIPTIAASDQLDGQAVAYGLGTYPLIGEEIFAAGGYLGENAAQLGALIATDTLRWLLIAAILAATALIIRQPVLDAIGGLLGGGG